MNAPPKSQSSRSWRSKFYRGNFSLGWLANSYAQDRAPPSHGFEYISIDQIAVGLMYMLAR